MSTQSIQLSPFCCHPYEEEQNKNCLMAKITAISIGVITLLVGILVLSHVPVLSAMGSTAGWALVGTGCFSFLVGLCLQSIKQACPSPSDQGNSDSLVTQAPTSTRKKMTEGETYLAHSLRLNVDLKRDGSALVPHYHKLSNLFLMWKNPNICFIPNGTLAYNQSLLPIEKIKSAFAEGKQMVFTSLGSENHSVAAGFSADGSFNIIDSMSGTIVNHKSIARALNQADIRNTQGKQIRFSGEYINTYIQESGNMCIRFCELYCYHMGERQDLDAFQEVNGAFLEGRLNCFEDYQKISGSTKIRSLAGRKGKYSYDSFMRSWSYRMVGWRVNSWKEFSLQEIFNKCASEEDDLLIARFSKNEKKLPMFLYPQRMIFSAPTSSQKRELSLENLDDLLEHVPVDMNVPIGQLPLEKKQYFLVWRKREENTSLDLFCLRENQRCTKKKKSRS